MRFLLILIFSTLVHSHTWGFDGPIRIYTICLNPSDSTVNIRLNNLSNPCLTFNKIVVKGREVKPNPDPFNIFYSSNSLAGSSNISFKQNDLKQREFFLEYHTACNGVDTTRSDTIRTDFSAPNSLPIDSVSVELSSQKVVIGWPKNNSSDFMGYFVYIRNGSNNVRIQDLNNESYTHLASNPTSRSIEYTYNVYDSCSNESLLAPLHGTMHLTRKINFCLKEIELNWNAYIGWTSEFYEVYVSINGSSFQVLDSTTTTNYVHQNIQANTTYCYFIRSHKINSTYTSSSNRVCQTTPNPKIANTTHINSISILDDNRVNISWSTQDALETIPAQVLRGSSPTNLVQIATTNYTNGNNDFIDQVSTTENSWYYQIIVPDTCQQNSDSTRVNESIFLRLNNNNLEWSSFKFEDTSADEDLIQTETSSTWNTLLSKDTSSSNRHLVNLEEPNCYRILTISKGGDTSSSNKVCILSDLQVYVPNAIRTTSTVGNDVFEIKGTGIDWSKTSISIFDRWGGKITEINQGNRLWMATNQPSGQYIYTGYVYGVKGEVLILKGKITILK